MRNSNPNSQEQKLPETAEEYLEFAQTALDDNNATTKTEETKATQPTSSTLELVNQLMKEVTVDEAGKFVYPDGTPEHLKYIVAGEKKFRDTQRSYTKAQQTTKELEAENRLLKEKLDESTRLDIPKDKLEELDDLKYANPDEWRKRMNEIEAAPITKYDDIMSEVKHKAGAQFELDRRIQVLKEFNKGRETDVTPETLDNDVPPRITKKLADGKLTFEEYLSEVDVYLSKGKVVAKQDNDNGTKLTSGAGSSTPPAELEADMLDYANITL